MFAPQSAQARSYDQVLSASSDAWRFTAALSSHAVPQSALEYRAHGAARGSRLCGDAACRYRVGRARTDCAHGARASELACFVVSTFVIGAPTLYVEHRSRQGRQPSAAFSIYKLAAARSPFAIDRQGLFPELASGADSISLRMSATLQARIRVPSAYARG